MKRSILTAIVLATLSVSAVGADILQPVPSVPAPGSPGSATPTPYPQVVPPSIPKVGGNEGNPPLLPKIDIPGPPKDQPLPGLPSPGSPNQDQQNQDQDQQSQDQPNDSPPDNSEPSTDAQRKL